MESSNPQAIIYVRVSSAEQSEGFSLDDMVSDCIDRCDARGWPVSVIKRDTLPGGFRNRPALKEALAALVPGKSIFVTWSVNRLGRDAAYNWEIVRQVREEYGCAFSSVTEDIDLDTSSGRLLFGVKSLLAQHDNELRAERIRRAVLGLAERGRFSGGNAAYGYKLKFLGRRQGCTREKNGETAPVVCMMFSWVDKEGIGVRTVTHRLNDKRIPAPSGGWWRVSSVKFILENPIYMGSRVIRRKSTGRFTPSGNHVGVLLPKEQQKVYQGEHPAIISPEQWARVQEVLRGRTHHAHPSRHDYWLTGILKCQCGAPMMAHAGYRRDGSYYPRYTCYARRNHDPRGCRNPSTSAEPLEQAVVKALRRSQRSNMTYKMETESFDPLEGVRAQLANVQTRRQNLLEALESGNLQAEVYAAREKQLVEREKELRSQMKVPPKKEREKPSKELRGLADLLESDAPLARKRVAIKEHLAAVYWENGGLRIVRKRVSQ